jgi:hypothetical protein
MTQERSRYDTQRHRDLLSYLSSDRFQKKMKIHRRVEVTAFRRKVTIVSGEFESYTGDTSEGGSRVSDYPLETVSPESAEGRRILADALRLLQDKLIDSSDHQARNNVGDFRQEDRDAEGKP